MSTAVEVITTSDLAPYLSLPKEVAPSRRDHIIGLVHEIRLNHIQVGRLMAANAVCLVNLRDELFPTDNPGFIEFCKTAFNFGRASVYRYISWGVSLRQHFLDADGKLPAYVHNINQNVFELLGQDIEPGVIEKVATLAEQGQVTQSDVKDLFAVMQQQLSDQSTELLDAKATISNRDAQISETARQLADATARADRNELHERELAATVATLELTIQAYQRDLAQQADEISALVNREPEKVEVEKHVLPPEYATTEEAVASAQAKYDNTQQLLLASEDQLQQKKNELQTITDQLEAQTATLKTITELQEAVNEITRKFPLEVVTRASTLAPAARATVRTCAQSLAALTALLEMAGQDDA